MFLGKHFGIKVDMSMVRNIKVESECLHKFFFLLQKSKDEPRLNIQDSCRGS